MAILHARVDERLIHGQVATVWTNMTGANRIIVANDEAVKDEMQIGALKMAKPTGVKLSILSVNKAVLNILDGKYDDDKVFLITRNIPDMARIVEGGAPLQTFNVGNISGRPGSVAIKKSVSLTAEDISLLRELLGKGIRITAQMLPSESDETIANFLPKK